MTIMISQQAYKSTTTKEIVNEERERRQKELTFVIQNLPHQMEQRQIRFMHWQISQGLVAFVHKLSWFVSKILDAVSTIEMCMVEY